MAGSLLINATVTPPAAAGAPRITGIVEDCPTPSANGLAGRPITPGVTVTLAVVLAMLEPLAVTVVEPAAAPVTGTVTLVALAATVTLCGTVALVGSLELRLIVTGAGAAADRVRVRFCETKPIIDRLAGEN